MTQTCGQLVQAVFDRVVDLLVLDAHEHTTQNARIDLIFQNDLLSGHAGHLIFEFFHLFLIERNRRDSGHRTNAGFQIVEIPIGFCHLVNQPNAALLGQKQQEIEQIRMHTAFKHRTNGFLLVRQTDRRRGQHLEIIGIGFKEIGDRLQGLVHLGGDILRLRHLIEGQRIALTDNRCHALTLPYR